MRKINFKPTKHSNICSQHFTQDCFKRECNNRVLKENAVPSLFTFNLNIKTESLDPFPTELKFPLSLPLTPDPPAEETDPCRGLVDVRSDTASVTCDHNYTAEDSAQQKKQIELLEEQVAHLKKKLKSAQQKCRRQQRQIQRLKAACDSSMADMSAPVTFNKGYVILRATESGNNL